MARPGHDRTLLPAPAAEQPLLAWLLEALRPMSRTSVKQLLRHGRIAVNGATTTRHDHLVRPGDQLTLGRAPAPGGEGPKKAGISIVYEDEALVVIDKPPGLLSVATEAERLDTAFARLSAHRKACGQDRVWVVHRLDRETSGLLLFACSAAIRDRLQARWNEVAKTYLAVVEGKPRPTKGVVDSYLKEGRDLRVRVVRGSAGARRAITRYQVAESGGRYSLLEVGLVTGRKHQIRVQLAGLGCPVIGDPVYGSASDPAGRLGLHAWRLELDHPTRSQRLQLEAPLPAALRAVVGRS
jgi:23S rRNA pseudouridine1911/1915/1917 synthase